MAAAESFGCANCYGAEPEALWEAIGTLPWVCELIDESHFHVTVKACPTCGQHWLQVFSEQIDWADGDDPQYWSVLPVRPEESAELIARGEGVSEKFIESLGRDRRHLQVSHPKGGPKTLCWVSGHLMIAPHD